MHADAKATCKLWTGSQERNATSLTAWKPDTIPPTQSVGRAFDQTCRQNNTEHTTAAATCANVPSLPNMYIIPPRTSNVKNARSLGILKRTNWGAVNVGQPMTRCWTHGQLKCIIDGVIHNDAGDKHSRLIAHVSPNCTASPVICQQVRDCDPWQQTQAALHPT